MLERIWTSIPNKLWGWQDTEGLTQTHILFEKKEKYYKPFLISLGAEMIYSYEIYP